MTSWERYLDDQQPRFLEQLLEFLRIPSISALPEHAPAVAQAAEWVAGRLRVAGLDAVEIMPTGGHPVVYGEWLHAPGKPTILVYGHFDTQPVDPLDQWTNPPFEPVVREDRVYARAASDSKGSMLIPILALEALLRGDALPINVKCLFEGEEEIGSPHLPAFLAAHRERFACDLVVNSDSLQWTEEQPAVLIGLKGICGVQLDLRGAASDLHSGLYGPVAPNPLHALAHILDSMRDVDGTILVDGFYDQVPPLSASDRALIAAVPFDERAYLAQIGASASAGERAYTPLERLWARPTLEVNGIWGGFTGEGVKTVIPHEAHAKITCRLVPDQDPDAIVAAIIAHAERHAPPGVQVTARPLPGKSRPYLIPADHWGNRAAADVLATLYGRAPYFTRLGGSVPVCDILLHTLGAYSVSFGFMLEDERFHAPDEFFRLSSFRRGQRAFGALFTRLGEEAAHTEQA